MDEDTIQEIPLDEHEDQDDEVFTFEESEEMAKRRYRRNQQTIRDFLGAGKQEQQSVVTASYYSDLLALTLKRHVDTAGWKTVKVLAIGSEGPHYGTVSTGDGQSEDVLCHGCLLLTRGDDRVVASLRTYQEGPFDANLLVIGSQMQTVKEFIDELSALFSGRGMYQGKKIELGRTIKFLDLAGKGWDDLALSAALKDQVRINTVDFLARSQELASYGIQPRRGIILAGEPGTGKTLIGKIIMNQSPGVTCILAKPSYLAFSEYIYNLYQLARDLKPTIVFLEDIDLIGEDRRRLKGPALPTLLAQLDGMAEVCTEVVTVATTNFLEDIDDALKKRPSRFDRIIRLPLPDLEQRRAYVGYLSKRIPMCDDIRDYMARKTEGLTPAQIQEVAHSLVIEHSHRPFCGEGEKCTFAREDVDSVIELIGGSRNGHIGFPAVGRTMDDSPVVGTSRILNTQGQKANI